MDKDEHFLNCVFYILFAKEDKNFIKHQSIFMYDIIQYIENNQYFPSSSIKFLFEKIIEDRELYLRYFRRNKFLYGALLNMLNTRLSMEDTTKKKISKQFKSTISFIKYICNPEILFILTKVSENITLDIEKKLESINIIKDEQNNEIKNTKIITKSLVDNRITTPKNWHMTVNNIIQIKINGNIFKKPKETILAPCDYEKDIESEDEGSDDEEEETNLDNTKLPGNEKDWETEIDLEISEHQEFIFNFLSKSLHITIMNFTSLGLHKSSRLGSENLSKIIFFNSLMSIEMSLNFLDFCQEDYKNQLDKKNSSTSSSNKIFNTEDINNAEKMTTDDLNKSVDGISGESKSELTVKRDNKTYLSIESEPFEAFIHQIFKIFFKYQEHSIMHKEIEFFTTYLASGYFPDSITTSFIKSKSLELFVTENCNIKTKDTIPHNLINICEVLVRIFLSNNEILIRSLEESNFIIYF